MNRHLLDHATQDACDAVDYARGNLIEAGLPPEQVQAAKLLHCVRVPTADDGGNTLCAVELPDGKVVAAWANGWPPKVLSVNDVEAVLADVQELAAAVGEVLGTLKGGA